jgi:ABC-type taurine transport system ATPase subunit
MTVAENVAYGLKVRGVDPATRRKCTAEMRGIVALDGYERGRIHRLSGGGVNAWRLPEHWCSILLFFCSTSG